MYSNAELLARLSKGEEWPFPIIYDRYAVPLLIEAYKHLQSKEEAKDAVQEVFISFYKRRNQAGKILQLSAYLFASLRNRIYDIVRSDLLHSKYILKMQPVMAEASLAEERPEVKELESKVQQILFSLPVKCRKVFILSRYEYFSYREIAQKMGISEKMVEKQMGKALRLFRLELYEWRTFLLLCLLTNLI